MESAFSLPSTGSSGHTTRSLKSPTSSSSPRPTSRTSSLPCLSSSSPNSSGMLPLTPLATSTASHGTSPSTSPTPPKWSSCMWVTTTASMCITCSRASSAAAAWSGPASTSTADAPCCTRIASPWPTSSTQTRAGEKNRHLSSRQSDTAARDPVTASTGPRLTVGHHTRIAAVTPIVTMPATAMSQLTATHAYGNLLIQPSNQDTAVPATSHGTSGTAASGVPPRHATAMPAPTMTANGSARTRFASGATSESCENMEHVIAAVANCATRHADSVSRTKSTPASTACLTGRGTRAGSRGRATTWRSA